VIQRLLIANRGEIAVRVARTAREIGLFVIGVAAEDDRSGLHALGACDHVVSLAVRGARAYLDSVALADIAVAQKCDAVHPGYGFLSENAVFAREVAGRGVQFVGPQPDVLDVLGDKAKARGLAASLGVPILDGTDGPATLADLGALLDRLGVGRALMLKAVAGGGGRGIRLVRSRDELGEAFQRSVSEAERSFGRGQLYAERYIESARHVEVQVCGDGTGEVAILGDRECSLQRRHQKLVEFAPAPSLDQETRRNLHAWSRKMAEALRLRSLATFEFLLDLGKGGRPSAAFIEANPRIQVEHTVTEAITGLDLVALQLRIAGGCRLRDLKLPAAPIESGIAVQMRINAESQDGKGAPVPASGTVISTSWPGGPGVRIDTHVTRATVIGPGYDSMIAKIIVHRPEGDLGALLRRADRALSETVIDGVTTNVGFLRALVRRSEVVAAEATTKFVEENSSDLYAAAAALEPASRSDGMPLSAATAAGGEPLPADAIVVPMPGTIISVVVAPGDVVAKGATLAVIESMKMEHLIEAPAAGVVGSVMVAAGDVVGGGAPVLTLHADGSRDAASAVAPTQDLTAIRPDLQAVLDRHALTLDAARPESVVRRHARGMRKARENVEALVDPGSFIEYGALAVAAQRSRRTLEDLMRNTPADGLITGLGAVDAARFGEQAARVAVMAYDYTVLAGTQGMLNHKKSDRLLDLAERWRLPIVLFAEGGGGRPGDVDFMGVAGLDVTTFHRYAKLSGEVPRVGVVAGRCFAGNAALLGSSDVIIATADTSVGMGGPAMIEGGGLGLVAPDDVGPMSVMIPNGVVDVAVQNEVEAVAAARTYLGYFQGAHSEWSATDQRQLRGAIPENRVRVYDVRRVIETLCDTGSVTELRQGFGVGVVTALVRIEGRPLGLIANNPRHLGGAIDANACDKLARFLQLCDAFGLPIVSLCDTPGFMVGVESEKAAMVRKTSRLFVAGASLGVPLFTVVLRKGYGLGAQAMAGGTFHAPMFTVSWPTGEFGGMGLEGAVRLGFRKELEAVEGPAREALYRELVAKSYEKGKATNMASYLEIDAVIDPAETRAWVLRGLAASMNEPREPRRRRFVDTW
jgi:acetyl/propionyl-CoA carboxylase alpha subunit